MSSGGIIILIFFIIGIVKNVHPAAKSDELQEKRKGQNLNSKLCPFFAPEAGLEPATLWLTVRCSNQLSYSGIYVSRTSFRFGTANVLQKFLCANFLRYFYENFASFSVLTCHFNVAAREIGIGCRLSLPPRSTNPCRYAAAGGPFPKVMVDSRGVTFIKNELFLLYSQVII